jgi:hypothetical protein
VRSLLMALAGADDHLIEAEPVVVNTDDPKVVVLELDDGYRVVLDAMELRSAIVPPLPSLEAAA